MVHRLVTANFVYYIMQPLIVIYWLLLCGVVVPLLLMLDVVFFLPSLGYSNEIFHRVIDGAYIFFDRMDNWAVTSLYKNSNKIG